MKLNSWLSCKTLFSCLSWQYILIVSVSSDFFYFRQFYFLISKNFYMKYIIWKDGIKIDSLKEMFCASKQSLTSMASEANWKWEWGRGVDLFEIMTSRKKYFANPQNPNPCQKWEGVIARCIIVKFKSRLRLLQYCSSF